MPNSLDGHEKRISRLEERDKAIDGRFQNLHTKLDDHKKIVEMDMKEISKSLSEIQKGQHGQELINQKMDFTLETINHDRITENRQKDELKKETKNDMKQMKYLFIGMVGTIGTSLLVSLFRMWFGI